MSTPPRDFEPLVQLAYETLLRDGDIALDVGAHSGRHCIPMARCVAPGGMVHAFEPLPMVRETLEQKIADQHPQLAGRLKVYPYALSNYSGDSEFIVAKDLLEYSGLRERNYDWPTRLERIPIQVRRIDDLFLDQPSLRFIKMDVEGGEYHVLEGALACLHKFRPVVCFEFGGCAIAKYEVTPADMAQFWVDHGYKLYDVLGRCKTSESFAESARCLDVWDYVAIPAEKTVLEKTIVDALTRPSVNWALTTMNLNQAERFVHVGHQLPLMHRFPTGLRPLARQAGRLVLYLGKLITVPQREFNGAMVRAVRLLIDGLHDCDKRQEKRDTQVGRLEEMVNELRVQMAQLAQRHANELAARDAHVRELERTLAELHARLGEDRSEGRVVLHKAS